MSLVLFYVIVGILLWVFKEDSGPVWAEYGVCGVVLLSVLAFMYLTTGKVC